jgi:prepilin-type N-terminal cleavage/methylation domain-containing protein
MKGVKGFLRAIKGEKGFNLMEVALAMVLMGAVAVLYLGYLATGSRAIFIADERTTAESLARTQMEYVRQQDYDANLDTGHPIYDTIPEEEIPDGFEISVNAERLDPKDDGTDNDDGIQNITVVVSHIVDGEPKEIFTLEGYRARR